MNEAEALAQLKAMTAWDQTPALTDVELYRIFTASKQVDAYGVLPTDTGWTPTWALNQAAMRAWRMKAGKAASMYTFSTGNKSFHRSDLIKHCREMANEYAKGAMQVVQIGVTSPYGVTPTNAD